MSLILAEALLTLPRDAARLLAEAFADGSHLSADAAAEAARLLGIDADGLMLALRPVAAALAQAPLSSTKVGTVCRGASGALHLGANLDLPGLSTLFTVHGEGAAIHNAWLAGETEIVAITRTRANCGVCLQLMQELPGAERLQIVNDAGSVALPALMPEPFSPGRFGRGAGLLVHKKRALALEGPSDALSEAALKAAEASYAPYTGQQAGVALRTRDGAVHVGRYLESMARTSSLPPVLGALSQVALSGRAIADVVGGALVEIPGRSGQSGLTRLILQSLSAPFVHRLARPA